MARWMTGLCLLIGLLAGCGQPGKSEFTTLAQGANSGITTQEAVLITSFAQWDALWQRHANRFAPRPFPPPVDFERHAVIALFLGERPTGGYSVSITRIRQEREELLVTAKEHRPAPEALVTQALSQPYQIVAIPKVSNQTRLEVRWEADP